LLSDVIIVIIITITIISINTIIKAIAGVVFMSRVVSGTGKENSTSLFLGCYKRRLKDLQHLR
jgi:hypothetical protein